MRITHNFLCLLVLALIGCPLGLMAQTRTITGTVVDETGEPMIGVSVLLQGTTTGAITDTNGRFTLDGVTPSSTLTISFIGYQTQEVKVGNQRSVAVTMAPDYQLLDEVVVVGYGTVKKRDLTGSVASVKSEDIVRSPTSNIMEAIQGQVPGLDITRNDGQAGSSVNLTLRGTRSINGSNTPLFIIDGIEGSYDELNPSDIASIEVLKDASSTAVYGAAGSNGVIIITTKSPQKGKFTIDLDAYYGWNTISSFPKKYMRDDYINYRREAQRTVGAWSSTDDDDSLFPSYIQTLIDNDNWVNWFELASQTGTTSNITLNTSYSTDRMNSYFSVGYYDIEGLLKGDELKRYSARAKFDVTANRYVKYGLNIYAMYSKNNKRSERIWNRIMSAPPLGTPYDEDGNLIDYPIGGDTTNPNPLSDTGEGRYVHNIKTLSVNPQVYLELTPLKGLTFKTVLGGYYRNVKEAKYAGSKSYQGLEYGTVEATIPNTFTYNYKWQNILTYNFKIKKDHDFTLTAVTEWTKNREEEVTATANDFDSDYYAYHNLAAATGTPEVSSSYVGSQQMSYVARLNYSYKGRYLLTLSSRWDGSSMLAEGKKWDVFPAGAIAWRVSDEAFMKDVDEITNLKIRASYGVTGNAGAEEYATLDYSRTGVFGFQETAVYYSGYSSSIANKDLGWEKSYMIDLGFDLGLLKDRINVTFDWYRTTTKDILYEKSLPYAAGGYGQSAFTIWSNVGETRNTGLELTINSRNFVGPKFTWNTTLTFSTNKEKVIKTTSTEPLEFGDYYLIPGEAVKTYYGYKYTGIWNTEEADDAAVYGQEAGDVRLQDTDESGSYSSDDYVVLGNATPRWTASLFNSFTYKNFDLSFLLLMRWNWTIAYGLTGWYRTDGINSSPDVCDYWTPENQNARYPRPNAENSQAEYQEWLNYFDGSYLKVKNITLGYTLPKKWLDKVKIDRARIYVTANNPFIFTKCHYLKNYDPEKGGDDDTTPLSKQYVIGINVTF